jgi:hypothetical protein
MGVNTALLMAATSQPRPRPVADPTSTVKRVRKAAPAAAADGAKTAQPVLKTENKKCCNPLAEIPQDKRLYRNFATWQPRSLAILV